MADSYWEQRRAAFHAASIRGCLQTGYFDQESAEAFYEAMMVWLGPVLDSIERDWNLAQDPTIDHETRGRRLWSFYADDGGPDFGWGDEPAPVTDPSSPASVR